MRRARARPDADRDRSSGGLGPQSDTQPCFVELGKLPQPAFAGYGIEGAEAYPSSNLDGTGVNSLAYLRVGGQACTYNVWSRLGRAHLERLLRGLTVIAP